MDVFIRGFSPSCSEKDLERFLLPHLNKAAIFTYELRKMKGKGCAILTLMDSNAAKKFLRQHGFLRDPKPGAKPQVPLLLGLKMLVLIPSKNRPNDLDLRVLKMKEKDRIQKSLMSAQDTAPSRLQRCFNITSTECGHWIFTDTHLDFSPQYYDDRGGELLLGKNSATLLLSPSAIWSEGCRIDMPYQTIETIVLGRGSNPTITITLQIAPKFYREFGISDLFAAATLESKSSSEKKKYPDWIRLDGMSTIHSSMVGACPVYQVSLSSGADLGPLSQLLDTHRGMPAHLSIATSNVASDRPFKLEMSYLEISLRQGQFYGNWAYIIKFQVLRLAINGFLPPKTVNALLPHIYKLALSHEPEIISEGIRRLSHTIPFASPAEASMYFDAKQLIGLLEEIIGDFDPEHSIYALQKQYSHLVLVHRVTITPAGTYLGGPELEVSNRVIRHYDGRSDYFLRVVFGDEDGERLSYDSRISNDNIYKKRFRDVLRGSLTLAGNSFHFLGFSHSSLRSQTCWFSAPFEYNGDIIDATTIIRNLGDFSGIRAPAKCAARIGQAFSDTTMTVQISQDILKAKADVERNGRVFSDGCGTISMGLLRRVWRNFGQAKSLKPTVLQIRFQGAKGLLSLDNRLEGEQMYLRESMVKFQGSRSWDIELCGGNFGALPMYLNRQFIKILEDLGVQPDVFRQLQRDQVCTLEMMVSNPVNAASFLELHKIGLAAQLPLLIKLLGYIGINFEDDEFLRSNIELAALSQLRELKYRSRIPLKSGVTLYGIMDESGYLQEGEIYCVFEHTTGGKQVLVKNQVVITRAPALHPGDIQVVRAVNAPPGSPLTALSNCIVFSKYGERDLPSQLGGGDLDGDIYNVIWDPRLLPTKTYSAADYPRVTPIDIGREITRDDMSDFFLTFMETDQLGRISNLHMQCADRYPEGVLHPDCIKLAELASTAVDFSKTGIPVNIKEIPRSDIIKPDFMAPGPRVYISKGAPVFANQTFDDDEEDVVAALDSGFRKPRYYESDKVLGQLFRDIDERSFLESIQEQSRIRSRARSQKSVMECVLEYVKEQAAVFQWEHYRPLARQYRDTYEHNLANSMYNSSTTPSQPISEIEVFSGTILGKSLGHQSKRIREYTMAMKEEFDRHVHFAVEAITSGEVGDKEETLPRAIACLAVGIEEEGLHVRKVGYLKSWKYIAAAMCLKELEQSIAGRLLIRMKYGL